jgi:hypothetical protein
MTSNFNWLPGLVVLEDYGNNWSRYLDAIYLTYKADFLDNQPKFLGKRVSVKRLPMDRGKEAGFWHLIQEGKEEDERIPNLRRCERIRWPRPIIEHGHETLILMWQNERHTKVGIQKNICLWFQKHEYLVVLRIRKSGFIFWTAYPVAEAHKKRKLLREYQENKKTGDAVSSDPDTPSTHGR